MSPEREGGWGQTGRTSCSVPTYAFRSPRTREDGEGVSESVVDGEDVKWNVVQNSQKFSKVNQKSKSQGGTFSAICYGKKIIILHGLLRDSWKRHCVTVLPPRGWRLIYQVIIKFMTHTHGNLNNDHSKIQKLRLTSQNLVRRTVCHGHLLCSVVTVTSCLQITESSVI